ncbi:MAG: hypothetical protein RR410_08020 [Alistipes sp.]
MRPSTWLTLRLSKQAKIPPPAGCGILLTPNDLTDHFEYAIGTEADRAKFANGTLSTIQKQTGKEPKTVTFTGLQSDQIYTIFARAYTEGNIPGAIASYVPRLQCGDYGIEQRFVTDQSAGFSISCSPDFYRFRYALGTAADRAAFENGTMDVQIFDERAVRDASFFNLTAGTEYIFFCQASHRSGKRSAVIETPVTTKKANEVPGGTLTLNSINIFTGDYTFTPNELCGSAAVMICDKDSKYEIINNEANWKGDILTMLSSWLSAPNQFVAIGTGVLNAKYQTPRLETNYDIEAFVLLSDKAGKPYGVVHYDFKTPDVDPNAGIATGTVVVSDITTQGATYTFTANDKALGYMYETVEADWYDEFKTTTDWYPNYLGDFFVKQKKYWQYGRESFSFTEAKAKPNKRYYAVIVPMNANGPVAPNGWGEEVLAEYTTLSTAR